MLPGLVAPGVAADLAQRQRTVTPTAVPVAVGAAAPSDASIPVRSVLRPHVRRRVAPGSLGFVLGVAIVFVSFGALFGSFGRVLRDHALGLAQIFGVLTIVLGVVLAGVLDRWSPLHRDVRLHRVPGRTTIDATPRSRRASGRGLDPAHRHGRAARECASSG